MAISRAKKSDQLQELVAKFKASAGVAFVKFNEATVAEVDTTRRALRTQGMNYYVMKKTLMALAAREAGLVEFDSSLLPGSVAVIVSESEVLAPSFAVKKMKKDSFNKAKKISKFDFAGAIFEGKFLDAAQAAALANTYTKEESLAKIIGALRSGLQRPYNVFKNAEKFAKAA